MTRGHRGRTPALLHNFASALKVVNELDYLVGREGARAVQSLLDGANQRRVSIVATTIGSVAFVIAATGAFLSSRPR
jgi:hypothetical protein